MPHRPINPLQGALHHSLNAALGSVTDDFSLCPSPHRYRWRWKLRPDGPPPPKSCCAAQTAESLRRGKRTHPPGPAIISAQGRAPREQSTKASRSPRSHEGLLTVTDDGKAGRSCQDLIISVKGTSREKKMFKLQKGLFHSCTLKLQ